MSSNTEEMVFSQVEADLKAYLDLGLLDANEGNGSTLGHTEHWKRVGGRSWKDLVRKDGTVRPESLQNFRRVFSYHFVPDSPTAKVNLNNPIGRLFGSRRAQFHALKHCFGALRRADALDLLKKHPCPPVGNPSLFNYKGYIYTRRWMRTIYFVRLYRKKLDALMPQGFVSLDIGAAYGAFSSVLRKERPDSHQILVDMPAPLLLARYFIATQFPDARIAGPAELESQTTISREFVQKYDFILMPPKYYGRLEPGAVDLITSFACLGELTREYFDHYMKSPAFTGAKYFFTVQPVDSREMFQDVELSILDYPIWNPENRIRFRVSPIFKHSYHPPKEQAALFYKHRDFPAFFEYMGKIQ